MKTSIISTQDKFETKKGKPIGSFQLLEKKDFLSKEECQTIIDSIDNLDRSTVLAPHGDSDSSVDDIRTSSGCYLKVGEDRKVNEVINKVYAKIEEMTGLPRCNIETLQVLHYNEGEEYGLHLDVFPPMSRYYQYGGQRLYSCLIYLNDVQQGGETVFKHKKVKEAVYPEPGKLIAWSNTNEKGILQTALHGSLPVIYGEKWVIVTWVRENEYTYEEI